MSSAGNTSPSCYILTSNPKKSNNLGPLLRVASAFGVTQVVMVGFSQFATAGSHGAHKHVSIVAFPTYTQAFNYLKEECGIHLFVGLLQGASGEENQIYSADGTTIYFDTSRERLTATLQSSTTLEQLNCKTSLEPIRSYPVESIFERICSIHICIVLEYGGLSIEASHVCTDFVHIPHEGHPSLLDIQTCLAITLHHFTTFAGYNERNFEGFKFEVTQRHHISNEHEEQERRQKEHDKRQKAKQELQYEAQEAQDEVGQCMSSIFGINGDEDY